MKCRLLEGMNKTETGGLSLSSFQGDKPVDMKRKKRWTGRLFLFLQHQGPLLYSLNYGYVRNVNHISNKKCNIMYESLYCILPVVNNLSPQERQRFFIGPVEGEPKLSCDLMLDPEPGRVELVPDFKDEVSLSEGKNLGELAAWLANALYV
jgi:hypothetical protein